MSTMNIAKKEKGAKVPREFIWPQAERAKALEELDAPIVDLAGFLKGDEASTQQTAELVSAACKAHGFFQVTNHGIASSLLQDALDRCGSFFKLPHGQKMKARRKTGSLWGYAGAQTDRFSSKLPYKETLSFGFRNAGAVDVDPEPVVVDYFNSTFGNDYEQMGRVYQKYCEAMNDLSLSIMELLAISLGVDRSHYRDFFHDGRSIMRCNYYPTCQEPDLVLGTGPHCDPTSLTVLLQDNVGGLEVFTNNQWHSISPVREALVINIGDTFMALSNGKYSSCMHRAVVNSYKVRRSLAFFLCPREDKVVRPPPELVSGAGGERKYLDFTWSELLDFTQSQYRADTGTLQSFTQFRLMSSITT